MHVECCSFSSPYISLPKGQGFSDFRCHPVTSPESSICFCEERHSRPQLLHLCLEQIGFSPDIHPWCLPQISEGKGLPCKSIIPVSSKS